MIAPATRANALPETFSNKSAANESEFLNHTHSRINSRFKRRSFDVVNFVARIKPVHVQQSASAAGSRTSIVGVGWRGKPTRRVGTVFRPDEYRQFAAGGSVVSGFASRRWHGRQRSR